MEHASINISRETISARSGHLGLAFHGARSPAHMDWPNCAPMTQINYCVVSATSTFDASPEKYALAFIIVPL